MLLAELQIKTSCDKSANSLDTKIFKFCQGTKCCNIKPFLSGRESCEHNNYKNNRLDECGGIKFSPKLPSNADLFTLITHFS